MASKEERTPPEIAENSWSEDETDLRRHLEELRAINRRQEETIDLFTALFSASPIPIYIARFEDGSMLYVNQALRQYFGWAQNDIIGQTGVELGLWSDAEERQQLFAQVREEGRVSREDHFNVPSGPRHALCSLSYVDTGGQTYVVTALVDITERVAAEARVRELATALGEAEQRERRRVAQLLHDDVQQLLYSIQMDLQMLAEEVNAELREQVQELERRTLSALDMTRSLSFELNVSALESDNLQDMFDWLTVVKHQRYGLVIDSQLNGEARIADKSKRQMLVQVLRELLFNVVKHAGVREAELRGQVEGSDLIIEVIDHGSGFDSKSGAHTMSGPAAASSGLGNVREQLRLFGGSLHIESTPGGGTRCRIVLPML